MSETDKTRTTRSRFRLIALAFATIALGLASRRYPIAGNYPGDALWATLVFTLFVFLLPKRSLALHTSLTVTTAFCVEFSQLYQAPWINSIRHTLPGRLILGSGFDPIDLIAYVIGSIFGLLLVRRFALNSSNK